MKRTVSKRGFSKRRGGLKNRKSIRRRRIIGGKGPLEKAVDSLRKRYIPNGSDDPEYDVISSALTETSEHIESKENENIKIIKDLAKPYYKLREGDSIAVPDHIGIAIAMSNYIKSKKDNSLTHRIFKRLNKGSDFGEYMQKEYVPPPTYKRGDPQYASSSYTPTSTDGQRDDRVLYDYLKF
jgi:hypothetical protein